MLEMLRRAQREFDGSLGIFDRVRMELICALVN